MMKTMFSRRMSQQNNTSGRVYLSNSQQQMSNYRKAITMNVMAVQIDDHQLIWGFDKQKDFVHYFPYFNCDNVMRRLQNFQNKGAGKGRKMKGNYKKVTEL